MNDRLLPLGYHTAVIVHFPYEWHTNSSRVIQRDHVCHPTLKDHQLLETVSTKLLK